MGLRNRRQTVFFLLVTKPPDRYRFSLNRLRSLSYSRCVPLWRAPAGTRTHVSGKLLGPSVLANQRLLFPNWWPATKPGSYEHLVPRLIGVVPEHCFEILLA